MNQIIHSAAFHGAVSGAISAAVVDLHAFLSWKSVDEVLQYSWGTAAFRWFQGAVSGAIVGSGYSALVS